MAKNTLKVIAHLNAKNGKEAELGELLRSLIGPTRAEEGCLGYQLWQSRENQGQFAFVEEWVDEAALAAHFETRHIQKALSRTPDLLQEDLDLRKYNLID